MRSRLSRAFEPLLLTSGFEQRANRTANVYVRDVGDVRQVFHVERTHRTSVVLVTLYVLLPGRDEWIRILREMDLSHLTDADGIPAIQFTERAIFGSCYEAIRPLLDESLDCDESDRLSKIRSCFEEHAGSVIKDSTSVLHLCDTMSRHDRLTTQEFITYRAGEVILRYLMPDRCKWN